MSEITDAMLRDVGREAFGLRYDEDNVDAQRPWSVVYMPVEIMIGTSVELNAAEQKLAQYLAKARNTASSAAVTNRRRWKEDDERVNLEGVGAELAFCRLANVYPDLTTHIRAGGADALLHDGLRLDVKATRHENGQLLVLPSKTAGDADLYALMTGTFPAYVFQGWARAEDVRQPENLKNLGYGEAYALPQAKLRRRLVG
jgi:hypothetical protein